MESASPATPILEPWDLGSSKSGIESGDTAMLSRVRRDRVLIASGIVAGGFFDQDFPITTQDRSLRRDCIRTGPRSRGENHDQGARGAGPRARFEAHPEFGSEGPWWRGRPTSQPMDQASARIVEATGGRSRTGIKVVSPLPAKRCCTRIHVAPALGPR